MNVWFLPILQLIQKEKEVKISILIRDKGKMMRKIELKKSFEALESDMIEISNIVNKYDARKNISMTEDDYAFLVDTAIPQLRYVASLLEKIAHW